MWHSLYPLISGGTWNVKIIESPLPIKSCPKFCPVIVSVIWPSRYCLDFVRCPLNSDMTVPWWPPKGFAFGDVEVEESEDDEEEEMEVENDEIEIQMEDNASVEV